METTEKKFLSDADNTGKTEPPSGVSGGFTPANIDCFIARYNAAKHQNPEENGNCMGEKKPV